MFWMLSFWVQFVFMSSLKLSVLTFEWINWSQHSHTAVSCCQHYASYREDELDWCCLHPNKSQSWRAFWASCPPPYNCLSDSCKSQCDEKDLAAGTKSAGTAAQAMCFGQGVENTAVDTDISVLCIELDCRWPFVCSSLAGSQLPMGLCPFGMRILMVCGLSLSICSCFTGLHPKIVSIQGRYRLSCLNVHSDALLLKHMKP